MTTELDVLKSLTTAIGKLNDLDDLRQEQIEALRDELRALSNRIEALTRVVQAHHTNTALGL